MLNPPVLIIGSSGMLGCDLAKYFKRTLGSDEIFAPSHDEVDITKELSVQQTLLNLRPRLVINAAGFTGVDAAETEREAAWSSNSLGPKLLARWCREFGAKLIHFSTDQVFDGRSGHPRTEDEKPNPINYYAKTKLEGENAVMSSPLNLILRVQWLYGKKRDRFTPLRNQGEFSIFDDQWGAPHWTEWVAQWTYKLLEKEACGIYHLTHDDYGTWAEIYDFVKEKLALNTHFHVKKTVEAKLPAKRPAFSVLSNARARGLLNVSSLGTWRSQLSNFLETTK